jgi:hypothetical protein
MVNNTILYSEFVFSSSNIKIEFVTVHFKTWLHDWFLELGLLSKKIGSYVTLEVMPTVAVQISTDGYISFFITRLWRVFPKKYTYKSRVEYILVGYEKNLSRANLVLKCENHFFLQHSLLEIGFPEDLEFLLVTGLYSI